MNLSTTGDPLLGENIKKFRISKKMTQSKFAEAVETTQSNLSKIEAGEKSPNVKILKIMREKFKVNLNNLIAQ